MSSKSIVFISNQRRSKNFILRIQDASWWQSFSQFPRKNASFEVEFGSSLDSKETLFFILKISLGGEFCDKTQI